MDLNKKNKQGGFIKLIIFIVIVLFVMSYTNISISDIINWFKELINNVL